MKKMYRLGVVLVFAFCSIQAKVLIMTYHYNRPDFIEWQHKTFQKFLKDDYEFVVFNDAKVPRLEREIVQVCEKYNIKCVRIDPEIHNRPYLQRWPGERYHDPAVRNANAVQYSLDLLGFDHQGLVVTMDSDMFLIRPFSFEKYMENTDLAGLAQSRKRGQKKVDYLWIGLALLNMETLPEKKTINFNCGKADGIPVDAGGSTYYYLRDHPEINVKNFKSSTNYHMLCDSCKRSKRYKCVHNTKKLEQLGFNKKEIAFLQEGPSGAEFLLNNVMLHYGSGTNWNNQSADFHRKKTIIYKRFIDNILSDTP